MKILSTFAISLLTIMLSAQPDNAISEVRKNKYQVELGFHSIASIIDNTASATILFKKKYQTGDLIEVNSVKYLRAYLGLNSQLNFASFKPELPVELSTLTNFTDDVLDMNFGFGLEKQYQNKSFVHYIGCDLYGQIYIYDSNLPDDFSIDFSVSKRQITLTKSAANYDMGLIPFFGFKYYLSNQFSVGIESGFRLTYFINNMERTKITGILNQDTGIYEAELEKLDTLNSNGLNLSFLGVRFITLGYSF